MPMEDLKRILNEMKWQELDSYDIQDADLHKINRSELKTLVNKWKYLDHRDPLYDLYLKTLILLDEDKNGARLTAPEKAEIKNQLRDITAAKRPRNITIVGASRSTSAAVIPQRQNTPIGLNITDARNTGQHTSSIPGSPRSAGANNTGSGNTHSTPSSTGGNRTGSKHSTPSSAGGNRTGSKHSAPSSARDNSTGSKADASKGSDVTVPIENDQNTAKNNKKVEDMKVCSKQWLRKHRCKLIVAAFLVACAIVGTILAVYYGTRKDGGADDTHIVTTDVIKVMNSSPTAQRETVISPQDGTEREPAQALGTEPPEASTAATSIATEAKSGPLRPPRKLKQLKLFLAILGLSGFVIVLIVGAMMMRKTRQSGNRTAR